ncbi:hypothetical protein WOLCODRAFT_93070 [Wolfiporia cocos MD-104 SS10]|uniref:Protein ZIP4 homolog n=1 Tax=Wolfiporia cocos (strain MD-104) TaxID=742152 RepID=A0A2H3IT65_WOLCO|nr:hypothetical protein WOLCODRAFT_93070 [Wolfiporia cocos MD-104 SS10]
MRSIARILCTATSSIRADALISVKQKLGDSRRSSRVSICAELYQLASLAESFSQQRPRSNKDWVHQADTLDREGVNLWNASAMSRDADEDTRSVNAALKLAGFRLVEAGLENKPAIDNRFSTALIHVLQLASKAGASMSAIGRHDLAGSVLACAAKREEALRKAEDPDQLHAQARARAVIIYYSSRMEAAWKEGNSGVAEFMLQKVLESDCLVQTVPRDRELLAAKLLEIGKSLLKNTPQDKYDTTRAQRACDSVKWLQKAFAIVEQLQDSTEGDLRRSILRSLARAYFLSSSEDPENLVRAEASLNELISSIDDSEHTPNEFQQLRWMRIAILKRRKAPHSVFLEAFQSIVDHMVLSETSITDILQELRTLNSDHGLVTAVHQRCLERVLGASNHVHLDRLLLSLIYHCSKNVDHSRAMQDIATAFDCLANANLELSKISATACLTLLWQYGNHQFQVKRWMEAADWFMAGAHEIFASIASSSHSKCLRKAALCHIQQKDFARAAATIRRCSTDEAATHYVRLLTAVHQGLEDEAVNAVQAMVIAADFNKKMLMLATRLANEADMKKLLLSVLEALLRTMKTRGDGSELNGEAITLIRCIIRLVLQLMAEPGSNRAVLIRVLIGHFNAARTLITELSARANVTVVFKDVSWLWRTAYNRAIQGCSEWTESEEYVSELFDVARQLLEAYRDSALADVDVEIHVHIINASFAAVAGKVFTMRQRYSQHQHGQFEPQLRTLSEDLTACKKRIQSIIDNAKLLDSDDTSRAVSFIHVLRVFESEILCHLKMWRQLLDVIQETTSASDALAVSTFEAITDILWVEKDCPVEVLFTALEAILHASLDRSSISIEKFSRWLRAICTMLLSRNTAADRLKAIGYVEQAAHVLEDRSAEGEPEVYPQDERLWLLGTSYNTGIECLHASLLDEAKRWFEASTTICRFVPDGDNRAAKVQKFLFACLHLSLIALEDIRNILAIAGALLFFLDPIKISYSV